MSGRRNDGDVTEARDPAELSGALDVPITAATLERALTHRSYAYENGGLPTNERLEFLGDSVLGLVVTDTLFTGHPNLPEGHLAKLRAAVVQMGALAKVARELQLGAYVRLGRGEEGTGGRDKPSILADTLEAVIGATYIDCGLDAARALVHRLFDPVIERAALLGAGLDWKTSLQELTAVHGLGVPEYVVKDSGPDHQKLFRAVVRVGNRELGSGEGGSKKAAEQLAAEAAWRAITAEAEQKNESERAGAPPGGTPQLQGAGTIQEAPLSGLSAPAASGASASGFAAPSAAGPSADGPAASGAAASAAGESAASDPPAADR